MNAGCKTFAKTLKYIAGWRPENIYQARPLNPDCAVIYCKNMIILGAG